MESVEVGAKTVDEAIDIALEELGLKRNQVDIEILTPGKPGLFGLGGEQARVRVTALEGVEGQRQDVDDEEAGDSGAPHREEMFGDSEIEVKDISAEEVDLAADYLRTLLELMEINAEVSVRAPETPADGLGRATAVLDIDGEDLGLSIGRRGSSLAALQYLVNVMVTRRLGSRVLVTIDVEHYHRRREDSLRGLAHRMADRVRQSRRPVTLEPMPAAERRIIHLALSEDQDVMTASVGQGDERKVVIRPRGGGGGDRDGGYRPDAGNYGRRGPYRPRR